VGAPLGGATAVTSRGRCMTVTTRDSERVRWSWVCAAGVYVCACVCVRLGRGGGERARDALVRDYVGDVSEKALQHAIVPQMSACMCSDMHNETKEINMYVQGPRNNKNKRGDAEST
jgi:hypothetical protein